AFGVREACFRFGLSPPALLFEGLHSGHSKSEMLPNGSVEAHTSCLLNADQIRSSGIQMLLHKYKPGTFRGAAGFAMVIFLAVASWRCSAQTNQLNPNANSFLNTNSPEGKIAAL